MDLSQARPVAEFHSFDRARFTNEIETRHEPAVLRGLFAGWPSVEASRQSTASLVDYFIARDNGAPNELFLAG